jgi:hypothetical protein
MRTSGDLLVGTTKARIYGKLDRRSGKQMKNVFSIRSKEAVYRVIDFVGTV